MHNGRAVIGRNQLPEVVQLGAAGLGLRAEHLGEIGGQGAAIEQAPKQATQGAEQQLLHQHRVMGFWEQSTVEKHATGQAQTLLVMPRQQLLGDAVTVVMGQYMHGRADGQMGEQRLLQVRLFQQAVGMSARFGRVAKPEHVAGNYLITLGQRRPQVVPVPGGGREAMDQQQRRALPGCPVANRVAIEDEVAALTAPIRQGNAGQRHQLS